MKNKKFLNYINKCLMTEAIGGLIPGAQDVKKAQAGGSRIGRIASTIGNIADTINSMGQAAEKGSLRGMINAYNAGVNKQAEMRATWKNREYILKQNFLKDVKKNEIFILNSTDELLVQLYTTYPDIKDKIKDNLLLKVIRCDKMQYNEYTNAQFNQLWGRIYTEPEDESIKYLFELYDILGLYISFNAEMAGNICNCIWVDKNYNPLSFAKQENKAAKKTPEGYALSAFSGTNPNALVADFLKGLGNNFKVTDQFISALNGIVNNIASGSVKVSGKTGLDRVYNGFLRFFQDNINNEQYPWIKDLSLNDIKQYFSTGPNIKIIKKYINKYKQDDQVDIRPVLNEFIAKIQ